MQVTRTHTRTPGGRIAYVGGRYMPHAEAAVHIEDRGLQFADAIYEVCAVSNGRMLDEEGHLDRLQRSLRELQMPMPMPRAALQAVMREMLRRNRLKEGLLYLQVTRGAFRRDHPIPADGRPTLIMAARNLSPAAFEKRRAEGVAVITIPDIRWGRCDIKTTGLLANVLAKTAARKAGAYEAWLVDEDGFITEGSSTNAWMVTQDGTVITRPLGPEILPGITRATVIRALAQAKIPFAERPFTAAEAKFAREAFFTSATGNVMPVVRIDGQAIGNGHPGLITQRLYTLYRELSGAGGTA
jgi:D-alanine transaminase